MEKLSAHCTELHSLLASHRTATVSFFSRLAGELRTLIESKVHQIKELDFKRKRLAEVAATMTDPALNSGIKEFEQRLGHFLRLVCMGAILLLRNVEGSRKALDMLEERERLRQKMIDRLAARIHAHKEMRALEEELTDFEKESGVDSDETFRPYLSEYLLPFEDVLKEVRSIDEKLHLASQEIVDLAKTLDGARPGDAPFTFVEETAVTGLLESDPDPELLWRIVQERTPIDHAVAEVDVELAFGKDPSVDRALVNLETLVQTRLEDCFGEDLNRARLANTLEAWMEYLARYPAGTGSEEARAALAKLEIEELAKAEGTSNIWDSVPMWRRFLTRFPNSVNRETAIQALEQIRNETLSRARNAANNQEAWESWNAFAVLFPEKTADEESEALHGYHGARVRLEPTPKRWREYLVACPKGPLAAEAKDFIDAHAWVPSWAVRWGMDLFPNGRCWADLEVNGVSQRFRLIETGLFLMGSAAEENGNQNETPVHEVALTKPYWIAETECTQSFWKTVAGSNPSKFVEENRPIETVSWEDCVLFLKRLNEVVPALGARLPTEAEWEYACRAGTQGPYSGTGLWQEMAWVQENSNGEAHEVKQRPANGWGLYDMHGNVAEWVSDGLRTFDTRKSIDPLGPESDIYACHRGGSWAWGAHDARSASRKPLHRNVRGAELGFRIAIGASQEESSWVYHATGGADIERLAQAPPCAVFLGDLTPLPGDNPYRPIANDAWGIRHCSIYGRRCETFVTVHPPGEFVWLIPANALRFTTVLGRSDIVPSFHATWRYQFLIDGNKVFQSPPLSERRMGIPVEFDIPPGARRFAVITDPMGDRQSDHAILAWPYFHVKPQLELLSSIPEYAVFAGDLIPKNASVGSGTFRTYKDADAEVLPIAGKPCTTFLDLAAPATVTYQIPEDAHRFTAIGSRWNNDLCAHGTWKYEVFIDGQRVFDSSPLHQMPEGIPIDVPIPSMARELTVIVNDFGENSHDSAILAYPAFHTADSARVIMKRKDLKPGEAMFRTVEGRWLCAPGESMIVVDDPLQPGVRFEWQWLYSVECMFLLRAETGLFARSLNDGKIRMMGRPDPEKEYHTLVHASEGRYAIRSIAPYFSVEDRMIYARHTSVGDSESFEIIDPNYPPPPRPVAIDIVAFRKEAVLHLDANEDFIQGKRVRTAQGRRGKAFLFTGVESGFNVNLPTPLKGLFCTISFWIYYENYKRDWNKSYWLCQEESGKETLSLYTQWGRLAWGLNGTDISLSRGEFQFKKWHHVAVVLEGVQNRLYVDGFPQRNRSCRIEPSASSPLWFGGSPTRGPDSYCSGMMEDVLILNRALSDQEIRALSLER